MFHEESINGSVQCVKEKLTVLIVLKGEVRKESKMGMEIALFKKRRRLFLFFVVITWMIVSLQGNESGIACCPPSER